MHDINRQYKIDSQLKYIKDVDFIEKELIPTLISKNAYWKEKKTSLSFWSFSKKCQITDFLKACESKINKYTLLRKGMGGFYQGREREAPTDLKYIEDLEKRLKGNIDDR